MALDAQFWLTELEAAQAYYKDWCEKADKVIERYREEKRTAQTRSRFNIFWSNIKTLKPAVYSRRPYPEVSRRHKDKDPVGRLAAEMLERALCFEAEQYSDVHAAVDLGVTDELLTGRGTAWARFDAEYDVQTEGNEGDPEGDDSEETDETEQPEESLTKEYAAVDYVHWKDWTCSPARCWAEVRWVARKTYLTRGKLVKRFGDKGATAPLSHTPEGYKADAIKAHNSELKQAVVWEIWHRESRKVYWVAEEDSDDSTSSKPELLDERDDFLNLDDFWPCPKPLSMSMDGGKMIPVPDYEHYKDQASELDTLTHRITKIQDAIRANALYPAEEKKTIGGLMGKENSMIPVDSWAAFAERGGVKGMIEWVPIDMLAAVLSVLQQQRESVKQTIYEITGLSDIVRGSSQAQETATAQRIKGQFASLRLTERQSAVAEYASTLFRIKAEIMATKYQPETLIQLSNAYELVGAKPEDLQQPPPQPPPPPQSPEQQQQAQQAMQQYQQAMQQYQQMMAQIKQKLGMVDQAIALLQSEPGRQFRIEVNADSFVQLDEEAEKQSATEFLQVMGGFIQQVMPLAQMNPKMGPMVAEMVNFAARTFKAGRTLEPAIEEAMASLEGPNIAQQQQQLQQQAQQLEGQKKQAQEDMQREKQAFQQEKNMFNAEKQLMGKDLDLSKRENTLMVKEAINKMQTGLPS
jgi:hypothetical protein